MKDRHRIFSFYELVEIKHNPERIGWGILKKKSHNQQRMEKTALFLIKGFLWKICNLEITLPLKSFVGLREEKPPISQ